MSIKSELNKTASYLRSARKAILGRGGEISLTAGLKDLPDAIYKIPADASLAYQVDDSVAYRKIVPSGAEEFAQVSKIGGMTYKCSNLLNYPYHFSTRKVAGIRFQDNGDGSITLNGKNDGTSVSKFYLAVKETTPVHLKAGTYKLSITGSDNTVANIKTVVVDDSAFHYGATNYGVFTIDTDKDVTVRIWVEQGNTTEFKNVTIYPMLTYEPYFEGVRNIAVTEFVSEGANLFNFDNVYADFKGDGNKIVINSTLSYVDLFGGRAGDLAVPAAYIRNTVYLTVGTYYVYFDDDTNTTLQMKRVNERNGNTTHFTYVINGSEINVVEEGYYTLRRLFNKPCVISNLMITRIPNAEYKPYMTDTFAIPEEIQALDGYGQSNPDNTNEYNYIDFERKVFVAYGHIVDEAWVAYETPIETDISAYFDSFIKVEGGGTITAVNEYEYDVPSTINYITKVGA